MSCLEKLVDAGKCLFLLLKFLIQIIQFNLFQFPAFLHRRTDMKTARRSLMPRIFVCLLVPTRSGSSNCPGAASGPPPHHERRGPRRDRHGLVAESFAPHKTAVQLIMTLKLTPSLGPIPPIKLKSQKNSSRSRLCCSRQARPGLCCTSGWFYDSVGFEVSCCPIKDRSVSSSSNQPVAMISRKRVQWILCIKAVVIGVMRWSKEARHCRTLIG